RCRRSRYRAAAQAAVLGCCLQHHRSAHSHTLPPLHPSRPLRVLPPRPRQPPSPLHRRFASVASSRRVQKHARSRCPPTAVEETTSAIAPLTIATTIRPASGSARSGKRRKKRGARVACCFVAAPV